MAEELRLDVVTIAHSKGLTDAARDVKKLKGETDDLGTSMGESADASDGLTKSLDEQGKEVAQARAEVKKLNDEVERSAKVAKGGAGPVPIIPGKSAGDGSALRGIEADARALTAQITKSKEVIKELELELTKVGNNAGIRKALRIERSWQSELQKLGQSLVRDAGVAGTAAGTELMGALNASFKGAASTPVLGPILIAAASVAALAAAPAIGAMISGAVVGAVGLGGIAGGIVAASTDPGVKAAWNDFTGSLTADGFGKQAFIKPVKEGIAELQAGLKDLHIGDAISKGAVAVPILAAGVSAFAKNVMPGFNAVMSRSEDIANAVSDGLGNVGTSLSSLLTDIMKSKGTMDGLRSIFTVLAGAITGTGNVLRFLGDGYHELLRENEAVSRSNAHLYAGVPILGDAWGGLNTKLREMLGVGPEVEKTISGMGTGISAAIDGTARAAKKYEDTVLRAALRTGDLSTAWDVLHGKTLTADESLLAAKQAVDDVSTAFQSGGKSIQGNTLAALENRLALEHAAQKASDAAKAYYDAHVAIDGQASATAGANKIMEDQRVASEKAAGATGKNKDAVHKLADELFKLPPYIPVNIAVTTTYKVSGSQVSKVENQLARFEPRGKAEGGPVQAGIPYKINERGFETVTFPAGGTVHPANLTPMMANAPSGGSASVRPLVIAGDALADMFMSWLRNEVGRQGGTLAVLGVRS